MRLRAAKATEKLLGLFDKLSLSSYQGVLKLLLDILLDADVF